MYDALIKKLAALPDETLVHVGHEYTVNNLKYGADAIVYYGGVWLTNGCACQVRHARRADKRGHGQEAGVGHHTTQGPQANRAVNHSRREENQPFLEGMYVCGWSLQRCRSVLRCSH